MKTEKDPYRIKYKVIQFSITRKPYTSPLYLKRYNLSLDELKLEFPDAEILYK